MTTTAIPNRFVGGPDYAPLTPASISVFLAGVPAAVQVLGGAPDAWTVREVGDGNLNLVFIVKGPAGGVCVKQALPYVRLVGESWPLPLDRAHFEHEALLAQTHVVRSLVPKIYHFAPGQAAIVMELLEPHIILRKGMIGGVRYPKLAQDVATFTAKTLFSTSDFASPAGLKRKHQSMFSLNTELCKITEDLVFTDPYRVAPLNRWTSPQLDAVAVQLREDNELKIAVQDLKWMFLTRGEAMLHGDLHTGSIMVTPQDTRVIDPEFAVYGPMGFDVGAFMANLLLAYFSQDGHAAKRGDRDEYKVWILDTLEEFWGYFQSTFLMLWRAASGGDAFAVSLFADDKAAMALELFRHKMLSRLFQDSLGFAGVKMVRRILGLAHVEDLESISDPDRRAACEKRALLLARHLVLNRAQIGSIDHLRRLAEGT